jgi:GDP-L-fucose synthase
VWDKSKPDGQYRKPTDNTHLKNILPNFKFTPLIEGLEETIHFFESNYNSVRK